MFTTIEGMDALNKSICRLKLYPFSERVFRSSRNPAVCGSLLQRKGCPSAACDLWDSPLYKTMDYFNKSGFSLLASFTLSRR